MMGHVATPLSACALSDSSHARAGVAEGSLFSFSYSTDASRRLLACHVNVGDVQQTGTRPLLSWRPPLDLEAVTARDPEERLLLR